MKPAHPVKTYRLMLVPRPESEALDTRSQTRKGARRPKIDLQRAHFVVRATPRYSEAAREYLNVFHLHVQWVPGRPLRDARRSVPD
jgi:hypothetical protein